MLRLFRNLFSINEQSLDLYEAVNPILVLSQYIGLNTFCLRKNSQNRQYELTDTTTLCNILMAGFYILSFVMTILNSTHFELFDAIEFIGRSLEIIVGFCLVLSVFVSKICVKTGFVKWFKNMKIIDNEFYEIGVVINNFKLRQYAFILLSAIFLLIFGSFALHCGGDYYISGRINFYYAALLFIPFLSIQFHSCRYLCSLKLLALRFETIIRNLNQFQLDLKLNSDNLLKTYELETKVKRIVDIEISLRESMIELVGINSFMDAPATVMLIILTAFNLYYLVTKYILVDEIIVDIFSYSIIQWLVYNQLFILVFVSLAQDCQVKIKSH